MGKKNCTDSKVFIVGSGKMGTAFSKLMDRKNIDYIQTDRTMPGFFEKNLKNTFLFLAVPDGAIPEMLESCLEHRLKGLRTIHFAGALSVTGKNIYLLHPFASIEKFSDLRKILFSLWGEKDRKLEAFLTETDLNFVRSSRKKPSKNYHTAAVITGNFVQYLIFTGMELLEDEGFSDDNAAVFIRQIVNSSLKNIMKSGLAGITGPAARGDFSTVKSEKNHLESKFPGAAKVYGIISQEIEKAVKNGNLQ
ncbi:MAG: DUF2520 domain-containing protein [bacterium]